jgi:hypothetical protein
MSIPRHRDFIQEDVETDVFIQGVITKVEEEQDHKFITPKGEVLSDAVRIHFALDGYQQDKRSAWMYFHYGKKGALLNKYLVKLVENAQPYMNFDIQKIVGMGVEVIFSRRVYNDRVFYNVEHIKCAKGQPMLKYIPDVMVQTLNAAKPVVEARKNDDDDLPF